MYNIYIMKSKKFILMLSTITAIGLVSITTISACSSVSQSVKDNFVDKDADTLAT
ncbi:hypothetical protein FACS189459_0200 [Bacilli bacterium]|nr:hypothetical protein FACS189459_0200 [Bacilli bacterium]